MTDLTKREAKLLKLLQKKNRFAAGQVLLRLVPLLPLVAPILLFLALGIAMAKCVEWIDENGLLNSICQWMTAPGRDARDQNRYLVNLARKLKRRREKL